MSPSCPQRRDGGTARVPAPHAVRSAVLGWYGSHRRDLPWRRTKDPYAIWVSEIMLQQTQAARVAEYWPRFLARFPNVGALARAPECDVLSMWSGLGYYRRARTLHAAAGIVVREHRGKLPRSSAELALLPGVGEYSAAAIASIAFGEPVPALDANAVRVLSRLLGARGDSRGGALRRRLDAEARRLLDPERPGDQNQAMMELGALVCTARDPACGLCPLSLMCRARRSGEPGRYPGRPAPAGRVSVREAVAIVERGGRTLLERGRHERGWWGGLWRLPRVAVRADSESEDALRGLLAGRFGLRCDVQGPRSRRRYSVTKHRVTAVVLRAGCVSGRLRAGSGGRWFSRRELARAPLPAPDRAILSTRPTRTRR